MLNVLVCLNKDRNLKDIKIFDFKLRTTIIRTIALNFSINLSNYKIRACNRYVLP